MEEALPSEATESELESMEVSGLDENVAEAQPFAEVMGSAVARLEKIEGISSDIEIEPGTLTIGRKPGNDLMLALDSYISGKHAEIIADGPNVTLTDLGSTNGTVVNGAKLAANVPQTLVEADEVQLGQTRFRFVSLSNGGGAA